MMIDRGRCMALRDGEPLGGERCQAPATHDTVFGRRCERCAENLRRSLRDPHAFMNVLRGGPFSEKRISEMVKELPS